MLVGLLPVQVHIALFIAYHCACVSQGQGFLRKPLISAEENGKYISVNWINF